MKNIIYILLFIIISLVISWIILPYMAGDALARMENMTPVRTYYDADGKILHYERTFDYQWREDVTLKDVSPYFLQAILSVEDRDYWHHNGVSYSAALRAFIEMLTHGHIVSGASTVTMQLVALPEAGHRKDIWKKLRQATEARKVERLYDKERILQEYVNRVPFGGKIYGIQAASRFYFDKTAAELSRAEATFLAGIPQRPNAYRPDKHFERAKERQRLVLIRLVDDGLLTPEAAHALLEEPLYFRDFKKPSYYKDHVSNELEMVLRYAKRQAAGALEIHTSLKSELQNSVKQILKEDIKVIPDVRDAAAVVIDVKSNAVLAMVGTLDFNEEWHGQINAAMRRRSAGSTLKPFIYAEAIDGGLIAEDTILLDAPLRYGNYTPENYSGSFMGNVSAATALSQSLNTPVIRLLEKLGVERVMSALASVELAPANAKQRAKIEREKGLTIALGTDGHSLMQLANAYACLARNGVYVPVNYLASRSCRYGHTDRFSSARNGEYMPDDDLAGEKLENRRVMSENGAYMVGRMLRSVALPGSVMEIAWKTGTSNGLRDAWCIAYTPHYVVGVWMGNKDGRASSYLVGGKTAAPCVARIFSLLNGNTEPEWDAPEKYLERRNLCCESGLTPGPKCKDTKDGWCLPGFVLPECNVCGNSERKTLHILSPKSTVYLSQNGGVNIPLECDEDATWYIDGNYVGQIPAKDALRFECGSHKVVAITPTSSASVEFYVK